MHRLTIGFACVVLTVASAPARAAEEERAAFGHMRYAVPAGWVEKRYANAVLIVLAKPPAGEQLEIQLMPSAPVAATMAGAMEAAWDDVCKSNGMTRTHAIKAPEPARKSFKGWEYVRADGILTADANRSEYHVELFVVRVADRCERVAVHSPMRTHNVTRTSLYDSPEHRRTIRRFVFGMKFDDFADAVVEPGTLKGDGIVGVWQGISMFGGAFKAAYAVFYSNGQVFFGSRFPTAGCDGQDTWIEAEQTPRYWGTYAFKDGAGTIAMPYGEIPIRAKAGGGLTLTTSKTDHAFARVGPVDGARFDGTYVMNEAYGQVPVITFTADGRFRDEGAMKVLDHEVTNVHAATQAPGAGTYAARDHTVTFKYDDGRVFLLAFPGAGYDKADPSPASLTLGYNEDTLKKR
jgi:hypothetical protein